MFRFSRQQIKRMARLFNITPHENYAISPEHALCIFLRRMAYPNWLVDLEHLFGYSSTALSKVCGDVLTHIHNKFKYRFRLSSDGWSREDLNTVACCVGFIDGTVRRICRPSTNQKYCYNGHKRKHGLKFQSLVAPNCLIAHLHGPLSRDYESRYHRLHCVLLEKACCLSEATSSLPCPHEWLTYDVRGGR
ncbi:TPA: hypothetical protein N0F65_005453 [Lagenidium giganteum]|uniref:DDE Tnp4 domain-containing protein n=1 Tax=Lagenidium giganteum TaxID=4803 RepID=A0AAV2YYQ8_9STRA|nr:TPA: hypothetical protein N0F65_005453 [Lagenidium giganteum]